MNSSNEKTRQHNPIADRNETEAHRREGIDDLKDLGLLSFTDKTGLTPLDTLFDHSARPTKEDAKVRPIL